MFPQQVQELMKNPRGLVVQLANFDITDELNRNFSFTSREVLDRTAGISFDLGDGRVESYRVATASRHDPLTGRPLGITMEYALSIIGLQRYETIRDGGNGIAESTATSDDEEHVLIEPGDVVISAGLNGLVDTAPAGDDVLVQADYETQSQINTDTIRDGGDGIADTTAISDDVQIIALGSPVLPGQVIVSAGLNGVLDSFPAGDDMEVSAEASYRTLTRFRDVNVDEANKRFWVLFTSKGGKAIDLEKYVLRAGDQFSFTYVQDKDDDGVWMREESLHGSSDLLPNTDGCDLTSPPDPCDRLTDKEEIQLGWLVQLKGSPQAYRVYPNPNQGDSDRDGLSDDEEKACKLDPRQRDSDLDGLTDWEEINGMRILPGEIDPTPMVSRDPATSSIIYTITPYGGTPFGSIHDGGNRTADTEASGDDVQIEIFGDSVLAGQVIITVGDNGVLDTVPGGDDKVIPAGQSPHEVISACNDAVLVVGFATDPLNKDTDGDLVHDGLELQLGINPNDPSDGPLFLDDDGDGVPNKLELDGYEITVNTVAGVPAKYRVYSNPNNPDSDGDGLPDLLEHQLKSNPSPGIVGRCLRHGLTNLCLESGIDTDGDGIGDFDEYASAGQACVTTIVGFLCEKFDTLLIDGWRDFVAQCEAADVCNPATIDQTVGWSSKQYGTNLNERDSDFDDLVDLDEINGWEITVNNLSEVIDSNPLLFNSDQDGWNDGEEFVQRTNPKANDTDGDDTYDNLEVIMSDPKRNPAIWDRQVTIKYPLIGWYNTNCDTHSNEEWSWHMGYRHQDNTVQYPIEWWSGKYFDIDTNFDKWVVRTFDHSVAFLVHESESFWLEGNITENDGGNLRWSKQYEIDTINFGATEVDFEGSACGGSIHVDATYEVK